MRWSIPYPRIPSRRSTSLPSRNKPSVGTTSTAYSSQRGFSSSSRYTAAKRHGREDANFSNDTLNRRLNGHHVAQNMTTVGSAACRTDSCKASGSRACNILLAFTPSEGDKASHVEFRGSAFAPTQRHIRGPPDTRPLFRSSKGWNGFACRFRGGPLLFPGTRVAGRGDVRGGPCRAGPRIRSV